VRIGIDARELGGRPTGAGRYLLGLLQRWATDPAQGHELLLYSTEPVPAVLGLDHSTTRIVPGSPNTWWEQVSLPRAAATDHLDLFTERVTWHRYVAETDLARFYQRARAFVFLSEYEGLGLSPLEALAAQVPPVLLDTPVARESCGQAALYVPPGDLDRTANALELALVDEGVRARLLAAAPAVLARYSWADAARHTMDLLEEVGDGG